MNDFLIEYVHRTFAATTGQLVILTMVFTLNSKVSGRGMKLAAVIASGLVLGQIALGAAVIVERLHALLVTVHLAMGMTLFSMIMITTVYAFQLPSATTRKELTSATGKT